MKIPQSKPWIDEDEINEVVDTLRSGWLTMGPKTAKFEQLLAEYLGVKHVIVVNSCTAALHLSLVALGIGPGDEVITTTYTFAATADVILHVGAKPVFVDIETKTYNIDPEKIKEAITPRTKAIMPVHFAGHPCDMKEIMDISENNHLYVIEDAAHALGAEYLGKKIGSIGHTTCFSFYATKDITTGEGGAATTNDDQLAEKIRKLRLHGITADAWKRHSKGSWYYEITESGFKYNITDIQSAIGIHQIKKLDKFIDLRRKIAQTYSSELKEIKEIVTPCVKAEVKHAYHLYPILLKGMDRDSFVQKMNATGISCSVHFIPLHLHPLYQRLFAFKKGDFPNAEWVYEREASLPLFPRMTKDEVRYVTDSIKKIFKKEHAKT